MKTFRLLGLLALLLTKSWSAHAQRTVPLLPLPSLDEENSQRWVVKFAPFSLFDPSNTIQFGVERMLGERHALQGEFGYGWEGMNLWRNTMSQSRYTNVEIWRGRAEWRYYWRGGPIGNYIAVEGLYKQLNANENGSVGMGCTDGSFGCQYYQLSSNRITKRVWAAHLKVGRQLGLSPDNRWLLDVYGGLGIRGNWVERGIQPIGFANYSWDGFLDRFSSQTYPLISVSYGIKIGYSF